MSKELEANSRKRPHDANEDDRLSEIALKKRKSADAQAAFRKKRANYITTLEQAVTSLESVVLQLQESCRESRAETQYYKLSASRLHWAVFETCGGCYRMLVASGWIQEEFKIIGTPVVHYPLAITATALVATHTGIFTKACSSPRPQRQFHMLYLGCIILVTSHPRSLRPANPLMHPEIRKLTFHLKPASVHSPIATKLTLQLPVRLLSFPDTDKRAYLDGTP
ncbi:hypothetical protein EST38_g11282 [Candolleomyces aberdarensis]|uniref:BZIP domain-containing protein n=1 Tax=Candolleomyces aberdarensis TaxID=2316362 RepID=A0A4V1Q2C1_9AGAR|nr:hypothetical protein EST38_g11282 [Candolleomyces aberdarensis]